MLGEVAHGQGTVHVACAGGGGEPACGKGLLRGGDGVVVVEGVAVHAVYVGIGDGVCRADQRDLAKFRRG